MHRLRSSRINRRLAKRTLMLAISLAYMCLRHVGRIIGRLFGGGRPRRPAVLTYHSVCHDDVGCFERQMLDLKKRARPVFPDEMLSTDGMYTVAVTFDDAFQNVFDQALPVLAKHGIPATVFVPTGYLGAEPGWMAGRDATHRAPGPVVTAEALTVLNRRQVKIGSHTVTHPRLARSEETRLNAELITSKSTLEKLAGAPVKMLALPYGSYSARVMSAACLAGYDLVFANVPLSRVCGASSPLVGRIDVSPRDWPLEFRLKMRGAYDWMAVAIPVKRALLGLIGRVQEP